MVLVHLDWRCHENEKNFVVMMSFFFLLHFNSQNSLKTTTVIIALIIADVMLVGIIPEGSRYNEFVLPHSHPL